MRKTIATALLAAALTGCASSGQPIRQEQLDQVIVGQTQRSELIAIFGQPVSETVNSDGSRILTWAYAYIGFAGIGTEVKGVSVALAPDGAVSSFSQTGSTPSPARLGR